MTRRMADSVTPGNLPAGYDLYAGYDDGRYMDAAAIKAEYPDKTVIKVTVFANDQEGDCLDVENGDATLAQAPAWVQARRAAGHQGPLVYCSEAIWQNVKDAFTNASVAQPGYWIAGYPGSVGEALYPGSLAHQWIDRGPYDESIVVDYLPGIDPPPPNPHEGDIEDMTVLDDAEANQRHVFGVVNNVPFHWWQTLKPAAGQNFDWSHEVLPTS